MWGGACWMGMREWVRLLVWPRGPPGLAGDAARALAVSGTNAAPAVPALVEVATDGFAGGHERLAKACREPPNFGLTMEARCNALPALAKSGVRNDLVLETFFRAWTDSAFPLLRYNGGAALAACGGAAAPLAPRLVATLEDEDGFTLVRKIHTLGELRPLRRRAVPKPPPDAKRDLPPQ